MPAPALARASPPNGRGHMMSIETVPPPRYDVRDFNYEADCKSAVGPLLASLLDRAEAAGWDRRRAASALMFLAARTVTDKESNTNTGT
jgi:hypothetical protein